MEKTQTPKPKVKRPPPKVKPKIEKRDTPLFCRVKPSTKAFLDSQAKESKASSLGDYLDALAELMRK